MKTIHILYQRIQNTDAEGWAYWTTRKLLSIHVSKKEAVKELKKIQMDLSLRASENEYRAGVDIQDILLNLSEFQYGSENNRKIKPILFIETIKTKP